VDGKTNNCFIEFKITRGDLVVVTNHIFSHHGDETEHLYGIVVGDSELDQLTLFPQVDVYLFKTKTIKTFTAGTLEILSHA
tara:strand:+ start:81 stop:323 length:243 start_codon:yes stop_codon:yes gene_type:complete